MNEENRLRWFERDLVVLLLLSLAVLALQFFTNITGGYGYFRDELYYIALSKHLAWGYVDEPPLSIFLLAISRALFGDSLIALRFFPAVANAAVVFLAGLLAREMGGKRFAQVLSALAAFIAPVYLSISNFYSMNSFDILFWAVLFYIVVKIIKTDNERLWVLFGLVAGLGLENKFSVGFLCFCLFTVMVFTPYGKYFRSKWLWLGGTIALLLFLPHIVWQVHNGWPTLEFMRNATQIKNASVSPFEFFFQQILLLHPFNILIWIPGLLYLLFSKNAARFRLFGFAYLAIFIVFLAQHGKPYYLSPFYTMLFASGAVAIEGFAAAGRYWLKPALVTILIVGGFITLPFALPLLPVESFIQYSKFLGIAPHSDEHDTPGKLDQHYADMFGWKEMAATVAGVYETLSVQEKGECLIFAQNYGDAGAIDFFGKQYGLPQASSGHNNYWLWGPPHFSGKVAIVIGSNLEDNQQVFQECKQAAVISNEYARSFETNVPVFVCHNIKKPIQNIWPMLKDYI